jgi:hypothetical protein
MASQTISLLALIIVLAFLAHAYYRWRNDSLRKLRGPGSSSFLYGGYHGYLLDSRGSLVAQETNLMFAIRRKLGIAKWARKYGNVWRQQGSLGVSDHLIEYYPPLT